MFTERTSVGLDVHARSVMAAAIDTDTGELFQSRLTPAAGHVCEWIGRLPGPVAAVYESGPTGFGLARELAAAGIRCQVAAPSKIQRPPGDQVKTDAKDAIHLARLLLLDQIVPVAVPSIGHEAARDLVRAREACRQDLMRARHRLSGLLLRHGLVYYDGHAWTGRHDRWLRSIRCPHSATQLAFDDYYEAVQALTARRDRLDRELEALLAVSDLAPLVARLGCLRGIATLTGFGLAVEVGDWHRFTGRSIGSFMGLVPSEHSSGTSTRRGPITRAGNGHARRLLIEAAWHHRQPYRAGTALRARWDHATPAAAGRGDRGNRRLHRRWRSFDARRKHPNTANAAIARELAGWCWSLAVMED